MATEHLLPALPSDELRSATLCGWRLSKAYASVQALDDVSVAARAGEVLGLLGENGAGKSTLVKVLSGIERPDNGDIFVDGDRVTFDVPADAHAAGIRIAPQELLLCPDLSVTENLLMGHLPMRSGLGLVDWPAAHREARRRLSVLGLDDLDVRTLVGDLTVVERAFVQVARALDNDTRVLLLDEPTAPMNAAEVAQTLAVLRRIKDAGVAIIYISHRLQEVFEICDRVVVLRDGRVVQRFDRGQLDATNLVSAMVSGRNLEVAGLASDAKPGEVLLQAVGIRANSIAGASLAVHAGEIVSIYGTLGSGRDQVGRALMGLTGRIDELSVLGKRIRRPNPTRVIDAGVGYVPAERRTQGLALELSIRQNLTLGMVSHLTRWGFLRRSSEARVAERWKEAFSIATPSVETPVGALSGGSQQKVLLARWLAAGSRVLVLEEPTRGVDIATKAEIYRVLVEHAQGGGAVLVISSDLEEVARISTRVLVMRDGMVAAELVSASSEEEIAERALRP